MRSTSVEASHPIIKLLVGGKNRKKVSVYERETVSCSSNWDGGSRDVWEARALSRIGSGDAAVFVASYSSEPVKLGGGFPSFIPGENVLSPGRVLVRTGTFCGKPSSPAVYLSKEDYTAIFGS